MNTMNWKTLLFTSVCLNAWTVSHAQDTCGSGPDTRCPSDMIYFDGNCYRDTGVLEDLAAADHMCHGNGLHILTLKSQAQQDFVMNLTGGNKDIMLDLTQNDKYTPWQWMYGINDTYRNFGPLRDFGRAQDQADCAYLSSYSGLWRDISCSGGKLKSICQIPVDPADESCPENFMHSFRGVCYIRSRAYNTIFDHEEYCTSLGAKVLTIHNQVVNDYIVQLITENKWSSPLIGIYQRDDADEFLWGDGTSADGFNNWAEGQPDDDKNDEDCAVLKEDGFWYDETCLLSRHIVCQRAATCQLDSLDPTWSHVSSMIAAVDEEVKVTCRDGMFHPDHWTKDFYITCNLDSYMFQPCAKCVAGCKLDIMYGSNNIIPLEQRGILEGATQTLKCQCDHTTSNGDNNQNITCVDGQLSPVGMCNPSTTAVSTCDLEVDFCTMNIENPGVSVLRETDELTLRCTRGCHMGRGVKEQTVRCETMNNIQPCDDGSCKGCE